MKSDKITALAPAGGTGWELFRNPAEILAAYEPGNVIPVLNAAERAAEQGAAVVGFISYEAAPGLDSALRTFQPTDLPVAWFGIFERAEAADIDNEPAHAGFDVGPWKPSVSEEEYANAIDRIKDYLKRGHSYQVNYTFRLRADFQGSEADLFRRLQNGQCGRHGVFVDTGRFCICSASPELFFTLKDDRMESRPMKGTAGRGLTWEDDLSIMNSLRNSEKNRAENVMIADMVRNDMGRIAEPGTVEAKSLFDIERYPTVWQMTSTVVSRTSASFAEIIRALFPCASVTGAPKTRTMEIIRELEPDPRGVYTGCIGRLGPGRQASFNVAIRTVCIDRATGTAEYGVGGGVVWDSDPDAEYEECKTKAGILTVLTPQFELLETILWQRDSGYFLLERHMDRLTKSAEYFGYVVDPALLQAQLDAAASEPGADIRRVRLMVTKAGRIHVESLPVDASALARPLKVAVADRPTDARNRFMYHKTTNRTVYEQALRDCPGFDDVLLWNSNGEFTESTIANLIVETAGQRFTPPVSCGLLPGVFRGRLLDEGEIEERVLRREDLKRADRILLVNSVRQWIETDGPIRGL